MKSTVCILFACILLTIDGYSQTKENKFKKHHIMLYPMQTLYRNITVGYEHFLPPGSHKYNQSAQGFFTVATQDKFYELNLNYRYYMTSTDTLSLTLGIFDTGDLQISYYLGPSVFILRYIHDYAAGIRAATGVVFQFIKGLSLTPSVAMGPYLYLYKGNAETKDIDIFSVNFAVGWRF